MAENIQADTSYILKQNQLAQQKLQKVTEQLATGTRLLRPGDDAAAFAEVQQLDFAQSTEQAKLLTAQTRLSWYQTSGQFLTQVIETLSSMSETAVQARSALSSGQDVAILDATFQGYKEQIASVVDGKGGLRAPTATFQDKPLFVGFSPSLEIGAHVSTALNGIQDVNLYTGYGVGGFETLTLVDPATGPVAATLTGTAAGGNITHIVLDTNASSENDVYNGMTITITGGTGAGETATIADYDATTRTATFQTAVGTILDGSSQYTLTSTHQNQALLKVEGFAEVRFAEEVWGADNDRLDRLTPGAGDFRALTEEEVAYRTANAIQDSDLEAKTYEEKEARRRQNIFDEEYGNLRTMDNANRMVERVNNAITQISVFLQRHDSRAGTLTSQIKDFTGRSQAQAEGVDALGRADAFKVAAEYQELALEPDKLMNLAARLQENLGRLNDLVQSRGTR